MKAKVRNYEGFPDNYFGFLCPGCKHNHVIPTASVNANKNWGFNGNVESPTFTPSILSREYEGHKVIEACHSYVTDGNIRFLSDCTHALRDKTVPLEVIK